MHIFVVIVKQRNLFLILLIVGSHHTGILCRQQICELDVIKNKWSVRHIDSGHRQQLQNMLMDFSNY